MSDTPSRINPLIAVAAVSVTLFSLVGIGVMTGLVPSSFSQNAQNAEPRSPETARTAAPAPAPSRSAAAPAAAKKAPSERVRVASAQPPRVRGCPECATVTAVNVIEQQGEATGLGAIAGGVAGGVLGNQIGQGTGRKIATVAGAAGGAYAGHQAEKYFRSSKRWEVAVRMESGASRTFSFDQEPAFRVGDRVKVVEDTLVSH